MCFFGKVTCLLVIYILCYANSEECFSECIGDFDIPLNIFKLKNCPYTCFFNSSALVGQLTITSTAEDCQIPLESSGRDLIRLTAHKTKETNHKQWIDYYNAFPRLQDIPTGFKMWIGEVGRQSTHRCVTVTGVTHWKFVSFLLPIIDGSDPVFWDTTVKLNGAAYHQKLRFMPLVPPICRNGDQINCSTSRFVYVDCSSDSQSDIIYVAPSDTKESSFVKYKLFKYGNDSRFLSDFTDKEFVTVRFSSTGCSTVYEVQSQENNLPYIFMGVGATTIVITAIAAAILYMSRVVTKSLMIIYCQCDEHEIYAKVLRCLEQFLEKYCSVKIKHILPMQEEGADGTLEKDELLMHTERSTFVIYVPFPHIADHHSYNAEIEECGHKFISIEKKIELRMPWYKEAIPKLWSAGEFKSFALMQDFHLFINYLHPFYYPSIIERFLRPDLYRRSLTQSLDNQMFGNSYIHAVTDPANFPPKKRSDLIADPQIPIEDKFFA